MKLIIDCCGIGYKIAYGMPALSFNGSNTHIIFGFLRQILVLAEKFNSNQFIFCWDSRQSYRKMFYPGYKNRPGDPSKADLIADAHRQFNILRDDILPTMGFRNVFMNTGYEADDLIAWICMRQPDDYLIVSGDEDMLQLLEDGRGRYEVKIYDFKKERIITKADFVGKYGFEPMKWADVKGLAGCSSDTVPGIAGVGEETAVKYINDCLKDGKIKEKIDSPEGKNAYQMSFHLVALPYPGDRPINVPEIAEDKLYSLDFMDAFRQYGCGSFATGSTFQQWKDAFKLVAGRV
jgi:5'-3' exonuclease